MHSELIQRRSVTAERCRLQHLKVGEHIYVTLAHGYRASRTLTTRTTNTLKSLPRRSTVHSGPGGPVTQQGQARHAPAERASDPLRPSARQAPRPSFVADDAQLAPDLRERGDRSLQVRLRVRGRQLHPDARLALGHHLAAARSSSPSGATRCCANQARAPTLACSLVAGILLAVPRSLSRVRALPPAQEPLQAQNRPACALGLRCHI